MGWMGGTGRAWSNHRAADAGRHHPMSVRHLVANFGTKEDKTVDCSDYY